MIKITSYILALVLILTAATLMAQADVQNLVLSRQNGETVLRIDLSQPGQAELAALPATSDKPFRVLVDVSPARHRLSMNNFLDLPSSVITAIRTSQFAMEPTPIVRIVLDLAEKSPYRLELVNNSVFIYLTNSEGQDFLPWSSAGVKVPVMAGKNDNQRDTADKSGGNIIKSTRPATEPKATPLPKPSDPPTAAPEKKKPIYGDMEPLHKRQMSIIKDQEPESRPEMAVAPVESEDVFSDAEYIGLSPVLVNDENEEAVKAPLPETNIEEQVEQAEQAAEVEQKGQIVQVEQEEPLVATPVMTAQDWLGWVYIRPQSSHDLEREMAYSHQPVIMASEMSEARYAQDATEPIPVPSAVEPVFDASVEEPQYASLDEPVIVPMVETPETTSTPEIIPNEGALEQEPAFEIPSPLVIVEPMPVNVMMPYHRPQRSTAEFDKPFSTPVTPDVPAGGIPPQTAVVTDSTAANAEPPVLADLSGEAVVLPSATPSEISDTTADVEIYPESAADTLETAPTMADSIPLEEELAPGEKPTSRFRRQPMFPSKLKGTIVAEFPTRMVIAYSPTQNRDPFETLLNDKRTSDSPTEKRIPDIETSRLVGVLESADGEVRALLEDLDGYGYIVQSGDKVKKGYVDKIEADKAYFRLFEYGWSRTIALYLTHN